MKADPIFPDVAPWPEQPKPAAAGMGHNNPPLEELVPIAFNEALIAEWPEFPTRFYELVDAAGRARATSDEELKRCGDLINAYRKAINRIDAAHKVVKAPYLEGGRLADAERRALIDLVDAAKRTVEAVGNAYQAEKDAKAAAERERIASEQRIAAERAAAAERERRAAEEAARKAAVDAATDDERKAAEERATAAAREAEEAMAQAALAPAAPAKAEPLRSDAGATISGSVEWNSQVEDYLKAFKIVKGDAKVREAIDKAIAKLVKSTKGQMDMPGVRIWPTSKANFR